MFRINLKKTGTMLLLGSLFLFNMSAELNVIPMVDFTALQLKEDNYLFSPSGTLMLKYHKAEDDTSDMPDLIAGNISYGQNIISEGIEGYEEKQFHSMGAFGKLGFGKNTFLLKITGSGAHPFDSYKNFEGLAFYSRDIIKTDSMTFVVGGGLAATDTGIVLGGIDIFVVPLPMLYFAYKNQIINTEMEWTGLPMINLTFFPENMFRIRTSTALAGFDLPTDLQWDCALCCYPFKKEPFNELVSISAGAASNVKKLRINTEDSLKYQYYCAYGEFSITALTIRGGYAFGGKQILRTKDGKFSKDYDGGFYGTISGMYKF